MSFDDTSVNANSREEAENRKSGVYNVDGIKNYEKKHFAKILTEVIARARVVVAFVRGEKARIDADLKNKMFNKFNTRFEISILRNDRIKK